MISARAVAEAKGTRERELATATGIEARGTAEAKSIEQKAGAMKLLHQSGQQHEEFRLRLAKERDVEMASIQVQKEIAQSHSQLVGEALKHAHIDIVGGENDFFQKIVQSVGNGKAVDRMVNSSQTLTDIKGTFFNGEPAYFKQQLRQWIQDFGIPSEDLKNLTLSALLARLIRSTEDSGVQSTLNSALTAAKEKGWLETLVPSLLGRANAGRE